MSSLWLRTPLLHAGGCFERSSGGPQYRVADGIRHLRHAAQPAPERWRVSVDRLDCRDRRKPDPCTARQGGVLAMKKAVATHARQRQVSWPRRRWNHRAKAGVLAAKAVESQGNASTPSHPRAAQGKGRCLGHEGGGITGQRQSRTPRPRLTLEQHPLPANRRPLICAATRRRR